MLMSQEKTTSGADMNAYHFTKDIADYRHAELIARAEQSRRYHAAQRTQAAAVATEVRPRAGAIRRPFAAVHAWLVAGIL
jgi:hypothetical protein